MRLEYVKTFLQVVNSKSFSVAAKELFISQPTVSTHIKHLEEELGVQLFVRSTKDLVLSDAGVLFYPYAVKMLDAEQESYAVLHQQEVEIKGQVTVAASSVPGHSLMPDFINHLRRKYPGVIIRVKDGDSSEVISAVLRYEVDFGICGYGMKNVSDKCVFQPLFKDRIVLITPNTAEYRAMNGHFPQERLRKEVYVQREEGSGTKMAYEKIERLLGLDEKNMRVACRVEGSEMVKKCVCKGLGSAFISRLAVVDAIEKQEVLVFDLFEEESIRQFYLVYHRDKGLTPVIRETMKQAGIYCQKMYPDGRE